MDCERPWNWKRVTVWAYDAVESHMACDAIPQSETGILEIWAVVGGEEMVAAAYAPGKWSRFVIDEPASI